MKNTAPSRALRDRGALRGAAPTDSAQGNKNNGGRISTATTIINTLIFMKLKSLQQTLIFCRIEIAISYGLYSMVTPAAPPIAPSTAVMTYFTMVRVITHHGDFFVSSIVSELKVVNILHGH